jgi:membrane-bound lytic murein transglycosylase D
VQPGETAFGLARRYGLAPADLLAWNGLAPKAGLRVGQVLRLQAPAGASNALAAVSAGGSGAVGRPGTQAAQVRVHKVSTGETLFSIARRYEVAVADLKAWNSKVDDTVKVGEVLQIK